MQHEQLAEIKRDSLVRRFCAYGFLKNLKFFEPYLLVFLMEKGISLFQIGTLIAVREAMVNIFEIPSGFIADYFGRKKELYLSFSFYIISFICFFLTNSFPAALAAMAFLGLGEAFRSGTHKAMIYTYLDARGWQEYKTYVYGRTRSFSLIGTACSSLIGILLIPRAPTVNLIFLFSIIPYSLDLLLILTYPQFLDHADRTEKPHAKELLQTVLNDLRGNILLRHMLLEEGIFESTISFIKDLIQPILKLIIVESGVVFLASLTEEDNLSVILGLEYAVLNVFGAVASRRSYFLKKEKSNISCLYMIHLLLAVSMAVLAAVSRDPGLVFVVYLIIYILFNLRKPVFVDEIDEHMAKNERATILSIASQLKSLFLIVFAPISGYVADRFGIHTILFILAISFVLTLPLLRTKKLP